MQESIAPVQLFDRALDFARARNKPVFINESAPQAYQNDTLTASCVTTNAQRSVTVEDIWSQWYEDYFAFIQANTDVIRAISYINSDWEAINQFNCAPGASAGSPNCTDGYWGDTRIQANDTIYQRFKAAIAGPVFEGGQGSGPNPGPSTTASTGSTTTAPPPPPPSPTTTTQPGPTTTSPGGNPGPGFDPGAGRTLLLIGQNYRSEYQDYTAGIGAAPAGGSVYGDIYSGSLNPDSLDLIEYLSSNQPGAHVMVGFSWKDDLVNNGYDLYDTVRIEEDIVAGRFDPQIDRFAQYLKDRPNLKWLLRIDYEVSDNFHCNTDPNGWNPSTADCGFYHSAYNHIADRIRNVNGVDNVAFVFHPVRGQAQKLYPGSRFVDWVGFSAFNHDVCIDTAEGGGRIVRNCPGDTVDGNLQRDIDWAKSSNHPVIIAESAYQVPSGGQTPAGHRGYLDRLFDLVEANDLQGLTYINSNWPIHGWTAPWGDSRVEVDAGTADYWSNRIADPRYLDAADTGSGSGPVPPSTTTTSPGPGSTTTSPAGGVTAPGTVTGDAGAIANGATRTWAVDVASSGDYVIRIDSTSSANSRLVAVTFNGRTLNQAVDAGGTIEAHFFGVPSGSNSLQLRALSPDVSVGAIEIARR